MSTKQIHRISIYQTSKVISFMFSILLALFAIPTGLFMLFTGDVQAGGLVLILPFLYFVGIFIFYAVAFWFYNFVASKVGGIELEFKDEL